MANELFNFRLGSSDRKRLEQDAAKRGMTLSELVRARLANGFDFPEFVDDFISLQAQRTGRSRAQVLEAMVLSYMARRAVNLKVNNGTAPLPEFAETDDGPLQGKDLSDWLFDTYIRVADKQQQLFDELTEENRKLKEKLSKQLQTEEVEKLR